VEAWRGTGGGEEMTSTGWTTIAQLTMRRVHNGRALQFTLTPVGNKWNSLVVEALDFESVSLDERIQTVLESHSHKNLGTFSSLIAMTESEKYADQWQGGGLPQTQQCVCEPIGAPSPSREWEDS
jgi:hypothetical protein